MYLVFYGKAIVNCKSTSSYNFLSHVHHALIVSVGFIHLNKAKIDTFKSIYHAELNIYLNCYKCQVSIAKRVTKKYLYGGEFRIMAS